eukprot:1144017-Rhodomonas_salina.1
MSFALPGSSLEGLAGYGPEPERATAKKKERCDVISASLEPEDVLEGSGVLPHSGCHSDCHWCAHSPSWHSIVGPGCHWQCQPASSVRYHWQPRR